MFTADAVALYDTIAASAFRPVVIVDYHCVIFGIGSTAPKEDDCVQLDIEPIKARTRDFKERVVARAKHGR